MNIKIDLKLDKTFIFALIPLIAVVIILITNLVVYINAIELKIPVEFYDPYDVAYGKYLNLTYADNKIVIPELDGLVQMDNSSKELEAQFVNTYYQLNDIDKEKLNIIFDKLANEEKYFDKDNYVSRDYIYDYAYNEIYNINSQLVYSYDYTSEYVKNDLMRTLAEFAIALDNSNMTLKEYMERLNIVICNDYEEYRKKVDDLENTKVYIYFTVDENGNAKIDNISLTKDKTNKKCLVKKFRIYGYDRYFRTFSLSDEEIKYYMDERKVTNAENTMKNAIRNGEVVSAVCKLYNNQIQIKKIMIGDLDLDDYMKLHPLDEIYY